MNKPYYFNQENYQDLKSLAKAYSESFDLAMEDVYSNTKKLVKFIKDRIHNGAKIKQYISILANTKYRSNTVTFLIFEMSDQKDVCIAGRNLTILEYLEALRENPDPANNALFNFLEDGGISKTYAIMGVEPKLCKHSKAIEKNFRNPFTYQYLISYQGYETKESINAKVRNIAISGEECFRIYSHLATDVSFQIALAYLVGYTDAIEAINDVNPTFRSLKLLKKETEEEYLRKIVDNAFFFYMLDNFDKYEYKGKAQKVLKKYLDIKKEYDHYQNLIGQKKISSISLDNYIDISKALYENYLAFVYYYHNNQIEVKRKFDPEKFAPEKPYCKTYIPQDYMAGKVIKLYKPEEQNSNSLVNSFNELSRRDFLEGVQNDKPELILPMEEHHDFSIDKKLKKFKKQYAFADLGVIFGFCCMLVALALVVFTKLVDVEFFTKFKNNFTIILGSKVLYVVFVCYAFLFINSGVLLKKYKKSQGLLVKYEHLVQNVEPKDFIDEEKILYKDELKSLTKKLSKDHAFLACMTQVFTGILCAFISLVLVAVFTSIKKSFGTFDNLVKDYGMYISLGIGGIIGLIFGMVNHKKSFVSEVLFILFTGIASGFIILAM